MSLVVYLMSKSGDPKEESLVNQIEHEIKQPGNDLFGFESNRKNLWGHKVMYDIGCKMIYTLSETDIFAYDDDLEVLEEDLQKILGSIDLVATETTYEKDFIEYRVLNALEHIKLAKKQRDKIGVYIG